MDIKCRGWTPQQIEQVKNDIIPKGKNYAQCSYVCRKYLGKGFSPIKSKQVFEDARGEEYARMHNEGLTYAEISKKAGVSRQRVFAIVQRWLAHNIKK